MRIKLFEEFNYINEDNAALRKLAILAPGYKQIISMGYEDVSTPRQISNGTIQLDSNPGDPNKGKVWTVHSNGYIRRRDKGVAVYGPRPFGVIDQLEPATSTAGFDVLFQRMLKSIAVQDRRASRESREISFDWKDYMTENDWKNICHEIEDFIFVKEIPSSAVEKNKKFFLTYTDAVKALNEFFHFTTVASVKKSTASYSIIKFSDSYVAQNGLPSIKNEQIGYFYIASYSSGRSGKHVDAGIGLNVTSDILRKLNIVQGA